MTTKRHFHALTISLAIFALSLSLKANAQSNSEQMRAWAYGFQVGIGGMVPTSSLGDAIKASALFSGGLTGEWHNVRLKADVNYAQPSLKNENPYAIYDSQGRNAQLNGTASATWLGGSVQLGYTVWQMGKVSVTPCAGIHFNRLSWDLNDISWERDQTGVEQPVISNVSSTHENSLGWMVSVDVDIRVHGRFVDAPLSGDASTRYSSSVRITPFVTHVSYSNLIPAAKGCLVGATVSYAGLFEALGR